MVAASPGEWHVHLLLCDVALGPVHRLGLSISVLDGSLYDWLGRSVFYAQGEL